MMINIKQIKGLFKELQDLWTAIKTKANSTTIDSHIADKTNPHGVTKSQVGLSNVDNTPDKNKPVSTATQQELDKKANKDDLHKVATSGQYDDLEDKPAIAPIQDDEVSIAKLWSSKKVQDYVQASEAGMLTYKGQVANIAALNAITEKKVGDTYNVLGDGNGANFTWNGTVWDELGMHILVDGSPTQNSKNPVSSGGVFDELNKLLKKDGSTPMAGPLLLADGGFIFNSDGEKDTGIKWLSDGRFAVVSNGVVRAIFEADGRISNVTNPAFGSDVATPNWVGANYMPLNRILAYGKVDLNGGMSYYYTCDGSGISATRISTGRYNVYHNFNMNYSAVLTHEYHNNSGATTVNVFNAWLDVFTHAEGGELSNNGFHFLILRN